MQRNLGIVVFSNHSGLGNQSRRLTQMLTPERILLIDSRSFSKNKEQHPEWYDGFSGYVSEGFPSNVAVQKFLKDLTHLYVIENPLNWYLIRLAQKMKIKTYIASNYEFCDNLKDPNLPLPDMFLMPSYWMVDEMKKRFGAPRVKYLPPPVFPEEFKEVREYNMNRSGKRKFLHIVGTLAQSDRNGTLLVLEALRHAKEDFELVIKSQHELPNEYKVDDKRVTYAIGSNPNVADLYKDFDALILPRRFGGLCLPMCEALMCGMPVIMPNISPNNEILSRDWLLPATHSEKIQTRSMIDLYAVYPQALGAKMDELTKKNLEQDKVNAFDIAFSEFAPSSLREEYEKLWQ